VKNFYHVDASSLDEAVKLLQKYGATAAVIGGGTEKLTGMKEYNQPAAAQTQYVINLKTVTPALNTITTDSAGLHVGPLATLTDIANSATVNQSWPALAQAAQSVATPNIRNIGTIGGNICADVFCWYFRWEHNQFNCLRKGGNVCFAVAGNNVNHSIFGGPKGCYAVHPSDTAVALCTLGASVVTTQRTIPISQFFSALSPGNVLKPDEIIKDIVVPTPPSGSKQVFMKYKHRVGFDFSWSSVGLLITPATGAVNSAKIWLGGVAPGGPVEVTAAESALQGQTISTSVAATVADAALTDASPMTMNHFKVALAKGMVRKALLS